MTLIRIALLLVAFAAPLGAQTSPLAAQNLRPFGYLFAAYALAWLLILGWIVSLARRLSGLRDRLEE